MHHFWLFSAKVRVLDGPDQSFVVGSELWLQVVVPGFEFEAALATMDSHVASESFVRIDLLAARRYDLQDEDEAFPSEYIKSDGALVVETGLPRTSVYILAKGDEADA